MINSIVIFFIIAFIVLIIYFEKKKKVSKFLGFFSEKQKDLIKKIVNAISVILLYFFHLAYFKYMWYDTVWIVIEKSLYFGFILFLIFLATIAWIIFRLDHFKWSHVVYRFAYMSFLLALTAILKYHHII